MQNTDSLESLRKGSISINDALSIAQELLKNLSHSAKFDADILLAHILDCDRSHLKAWPEKLLSFAQANTFSELLAERSSGKPIAYILGSKGFWTFDVEVNEHTLVPRPETEILVEYALGLIPQDDEFLVADICTGSGAIAFAIASERKACTVHASDIDDKALEVARRTQQKLQLQNIDFYSGDLYSALPKSKQGYDLIVSNPPYIDRNDPYLLHPTMQHEPRHALIAENNGLAIIEKLLGHVKKYLRQNGYLLIEHGHEQAENIRQLTKNHQLQYLICIQDYQALDRISVIQYR